MYYVYILGSFKNHKIYIGRTDDLKRRVKEHLKGNTRTTKSMHPFKLVFYEAFCNKEDSIRRERCLKTSKGKTSLKLIIRESIK